MALSDVKTLVVTTALADPIPNFQLLVQQAQDAAEDAEGSALAAEQWADQVGDLVAQAYQFKTLAMAQAANIAGGIDRVKILYYDTNYVEGSEADYIRVAAEPSHPGKFQSVGGQWWEIANEILRPEMRGAIGNGDEGNIVADTYGVQDILDISAATFREARGKVGTYVIDSYKGARPSWTNGGRWTHGGIIFPSGCKFVGAGHGRTTFLNGSSPGRCLARVRDEGSSWIEGVTFDYDFPNKTSVPYATPATSTTGQGGTGLLYEGGGVTVMNITLKDVEFKNTYGYGCGIENVTISSALIDGVYLDKVGADGIDIKSWPLAAPGGPKVGIITNVFAPNGCGWNYIATGEEGGHDDQAVLDIGGTWHVSNVHIEGLTCDPASTGNTGIRFRSAVTADTREGAVRSTLTGFSIRSVKAAGVGTDTSNNIIGLGVYSPSVNISNGYVDNCRYNMLVASYGAAENPDPYDVNISNLTLHGANGATASGANIKFSASVRDTNLLGMMIRGGDTGIDLDGSGGTLELNIEECTLGIKCSKTIWRNYTWVGLHLASNTTDTSAFAEIVGNSIVADRGAAVVGDRQSWINIHAIANDSSWSGEDSWVGGIKLWSHDTDAGGPVELGRIGPQSLTSSGSAWQQYFGLGAVSIRVRSDRIMMSRSVIGNYADDTAAAAAGVPLDGLYRTGSALKIRVA